jgi:hypothetical protein
MQTINTPSKDEIAQEVEIFFSADFASMTLSDLLNWDKDYSGFVDQFRGSFEWNESQRKAYDYVKYRIEEETHKKDMVKIGDVFYSSWGYEQTNIEFFKIMSISKTGKTCEVVQVAGALIGDHSKITQQMCGNMVPDSNTVINPKPCKVKIERCTVWNPYKKTRVPVGEYNLRGSVYYTTDSKHLQTLRRVTGSVWASWYA